jgi:hypothetical protein
MERKGQGVGTNSVFSIALGEKMRLLPLVIVVEGLWRIDKMMFCNKCWLVAALQLASGDYPLVVSRSDGPRGCRNSEEPSRDDLMLPGY